MKKTMFALILALALALCSCGGDRFGVYDISNICQLVYTDIDLVCETPELAEKGRAMLFDAQSEGTLLLSLVMDSTIMLTEEELGEYDHLVFTDPEWIERFGDPSLLSELSFDDIPAAMREFLEVQMPVITLDGSVCPSGVRFCEYAGDELLCYPTNVGYGPEAILAKAPLIVLIDDPVSAMSAGGFMIPLSSSGNVMFTDIDALRSSIERNGLSKYVSDIQDVTFR